MISPQLDSIVKAVEPCYVTPDEQALLYKGDCLELLERLPRGCAQLIFADPPYFLSNGGITCQSGTMVSVNKGEWDRLPEGFADTHEFNRAWIRACRGVLAETGTLWVSGTLHNIYSIGMALQQEGFALINNITWEKSNPPPNLACRCFTHSTETVLWARKQEQHRYTFNYQLMKELNGGKQQKDVWRGPLTPPSEKSFGRHPTQKPLYLLETIIKASSNPQDVVLDPFSGSSTTGVAALKLGRQFVGIEGNELFIGLSRSRLRTASISATHGGVQSDNEAAPAAPKKRRGRPRRTYEGTVDLFASLS